MKKFILLKKRIKKNEGFRNKSYSDSLGFKTIGYGHLIKKNETRFLKKSFSKKYLTKLFDKDFCKALDDYIKNYSTKKYSKNTKEVLLEMIFQMGIKKQKKFYKMNKYLENKLFFMAALEMQKSLWYKQTPKRVNGLIKILLKKYYE